MKLYSIFDKVAGVYSSPFGCVNDGVAKRQFSKFCNDADSDLKGSATDYELYSVGDFVETAGTLDYKFDLVVKGVASNE